MELTERCNSNCIHCYINLAADDLTAKERELSTDDIKKILEEAVSLGCLMVRFTGGEPLLREDFEELYLFARRLGLKVLIFTNATRITSSLADLFARIPPLERIEISVYGLEKNSYEAVTRVPGSFKAAWQGINRLLNKKVPFIVKGALLPPNKDEVEAFTAWAATIPWMDHPPTFSMVLDLRCRRDSEPKNRLIRSLRSSPREVLQVLTKKPEKYLKTSMAFSSKFIRPPGNKLFSCGAGAGSACVDAYGNLQACILLRHPETIYNLKEGSLKDGMTGFFPNMRHITANNPDYLNRCARCFLKSLCEQCPAKSWMEHGTLDTPVHYLCELAHAQARFLGLLTEGESAWEVKNQDDRIDTCLTRLPN
jgi:radical SAM protein with 4Fe4S-binding SPASM domain